jgi:ABC-type nickel/cobalt efflux system permease component RcnA
MHPEPEWSVRSKKNAWVFVRETFLYGVVIFVLLACIRSMWHLSFAVSLFEIWAVSTVVFAPVVYFGKRLVVEAFKW